MAEKRLTKEIAEQFLADVDSVDLSEFNEIDDAAAEILSNCTDTWLSLGGLTSLSDAAAESLSKHIFAIELEGLTSLSDEVAESLSQHKSDLYLDGLTSLSDVAAESLKKHKGYLSLGGLTSLSDVVAESLSQHESGLSLCGLTSLSDVAAESLSQHKSDLYLDGLTSLSDVAAESLSQHESGLSLELDLIPASAAAFLCQHPSFQVAEETSRGEDGQVTHHSRFSPDSFLPPGLPKIIPLTKTGEPLDSYKTPSTVSHPSDLPSRLFLGLIDISTFTRSENGWTVCYVGDEPDTRVELEWDHETGILSLTQLWRGLIGTMCGSDDDDFRELIRKAYTVFPGNWDANAKHDLESRYNLRYLEAAPDAPVFRGFPDGAFKTVVCPVPISQLRHSVDWARSVRETPELSPVSSFLRFGFSVINYVDGKNTHPFDHEVTAAVTTMMEWGLPPFTPPRWETAEDGTRALTVTRTHYWFVVQCPFRILEPTIESLTRFNLLGELCDGPFVAVTPMCERFEATSFVLPSGLEAMGSEVCFFDTDARRRFYTTSICGPSDLMTHSDADITLATEESLELISRIEEFSHDSLIPIRCEEYRIEGQAWDPVLDAIFLAAKAGDCGVVQHLVKSGTDVDLRDSSNCTPLIWAAQHGHTATIEYLLSRGADPTATDDDGDSALLLAERHGHNDAASVLRRLP